jgi:hypothetical protein
MNELLYRVWKGERAAPAVHDSAELRFNGDRAAFLNGDRQAFYAMLDSGNAIWLNSNVIVYKDRLPEYFSKFIKERFDTRALLWNFDIVFDRELLSYVV